VALSQKHRSVLFDYLAPRVGEEVTEALMAEFPARDGDELVTKEFLRAELADVRTEIAGLRTEVRTEIAGLRGELHAGLAGVRSDLTIRLTGVIGVATAIIVAAG
jgi:alanine dehydrogenase